MTTSHDTLRPVPAPYRATESFWTAAANGSLMLQRCATGHVRHYPRGHCPECGSTDLEQFASSGRGRVHTFSVVHRAAHEGFADRTPYVFAIVELIEGVRVTANIVGLDPADVSVDLPVRATFDDELGGITLPQFAPDRDR